MGGHGGAAAAALQDGGSAAQAWGGRLERDQVFPELILAALSDALPASPMRRVAPLDFLKLSTALQSPSPTPHSPLEVRKTRAGCPALEDP